MIQEEYKKNQIVIIDYGMGNLGSIQNMLKYLNIGSIISNSRNDILNATKLILPGVGSFDSGIKNLKRLELFDAIIEAVKEKRGHILGICLGMQLLGKTSEEGILEGLNLINAETYKFNFQINTRKIPHMGWNFINKTKDHPLIKGLSDDARFYFVHSYYVQCEQSHDILMNCEYGITFHAAFAHDNILGVQFHPEKSHRFGMQIFKNFVDL